MSIRRRNRSRFEDEVDKRATVEFIEDRALLRYNTRALEQAGVFMRVRSISKLTEQLFGDALEKCALPAFEAAHAVRELEGMNITSRQLFRDLEGAARTVRIRAVI